MGSQISISVKNLTKSYKLYHSPFDRLKETFHPFRKDLHRNFCALNNINIDVIRGETIGIIGRNGSGKSTLLQIICGIMQPTSGSVEVYGRISALLELGTGFNPEYTGRQNIYISCSIVGMLHDEIQNRIDQIIDFAGIGDFIDQPVKTYSSGMYVRLAFSVAISVDPEILVIDEALSVGDEAFQRKCYSKFHNFKENGVTVIFVSHSGTAILELCDKAILLDNGELLMVGKPKAVVSQYYKLIFAPEDKVLLLREKIINSQIEDINDKNNTAKITIKEKLKEDLTTKSYFDPNIKSQSEVRYVPHGAIIKSPHICTLVGKQVNVLCRGVEYLYRYSVEFTRPVQDVRFGMLIKTITGVELGGALSHPPGKHIKYVDESTIFEVEFKFACLLTSGVYFLNSGVQGVLDEKDGYLDRIIDAVMFKVHYEKEIISTAIVDFKITPTLTKIPFSSRHDE